jgi:hypothetical protein
MSITPAISAGTNFVVASPKKAVRNVPTVNGSANVAPPNGTSAAIAWPANFVIVTGSEMLAPMPKVPEKEALIDRDAAPDNFGKCNDTANVASSSTMEGVWMSWVVPDKVTPNVTVFNRFVV